METYPEFQITQYSTKNVLTSLDRLCVLVTFLPRDRPQQLVPSLPYSSAAEFSFALRYCRQAEYPTNEQWELDFL